MGAIEKTLKERAGGLFLLVLAGLIFAGISFNSPKAQSKDAKIVSDANQTQDEASRDFSENVSELANDSGNINPDISQNIENKESDNQEETQKGGKKINDEKNASNSEDAYYNDLKESLKKYCGKKFNVKKCKDSLKDAKDARNRGNRFKDLYKKYHFEKKEEDNKNITSANNTSSTDSNSSTNSNPKSSLYVSSGGDAKSFDVASPSGISVIDLMDLLQADSSKNFTYHSSAGFVDKINGIGAQGNMSWMLYTCKSDICKLSSVGASDCKVGDWDKIEWKYVDWTTMDWTTW